MTVHIIADSAADISADADSRLTVLPLTVAFGEDIYRDGVDISKERFFEMLIESDELPTTGQVNPYAYTEAIEQAHAAGADEIVILTISAKLSGTNQSAVSAAAEAGGEQAGIYVVDTMSATVGERVLVEYALRLAHEGWKASEIVREIENRRADVCVIGLLDTLEYLRRGGRVPAAAAVIGELFSIKPVITIRDGEVALLGKARGSKNGKNLLNREIEAAGGVDFSMPLCLGYAGLTDRLLQKYIDDSRALWEDAAPRDQLPITRVGATIGTHVGPGAIALAFFKRA
ncbi:DegV family protein [Collinsella sp. AGMB00827]|uniref:DegV family protein n=1 Tax=Collinsella ureilytica TaxID=2869515 RepID=A0ABS7MKK6_9ACTN|nr:DegV family protein [Collinsella urealyticum]MBY4796925.1 DegV family protein [Collinsella urealyticum]